jgi:hypothetical protein
VIVWVSWQSSWPPKGLPINDVKRLPITNVAISQNVFLTLDRRGRMRKGKDFGI